MVEAEEEVEGALDKESFLRAVYEANRPQVVDKEQEDNGGEGTSKESKRRIIMRQPFGVISILGPWNFPVDEILLLALPALMAGNGVVIKPSEVTPLVGGKVVERLSAEVERCWHERKGGGGVSVQGIIGLVQGDGQVGSLLVNHPLVKLIGMTGSTATGKKLVQAASNSLKRCILELGGKDPMVVFRDANIPEAAVAAVQHSLENCGQVCCSFERVYVDEVVKEEFENLVVQEAKKWTYGDGRGKATRMGPLVSYTQRNHVHQQVLSAITEGASLLLGGKLPPADAPGSFYPPTVLTNVPQTSSMTRNETFGPVVAITPFNGTEAEAIKLANDTQYGLSAAVYSQDIDKAFRVANRIHAGQVGINGYALACGGTHCPWVG